MAETSEKDELQRYLQLARDALLWKLDGLSEYDVRRPLVPTGTNLLGIVKHVASVEHAYFTLTFGRPLTEDLAWLADDADPNADMWATADETRADIVDFYHRVWRSTDAVIAELPLDALGEVHWWPEGRRQVTLHRCLVHMIAETNRHAGHADIVRELVDGGVGMRSDNRSLPDGDERWWSAHRDRVEAAAVAAASRAR